MKIAIDARMYSWPGIGRYTRHLLGELERQDSQNNYLVLLRRTDFGKYSPQSPNFTKIVADYRPFSLSEQLGFCWFLYRLKADLVHFTNFSQPLLYLRPRVTNIHDLTLVDYKNIREGSKLRYEVKYWAFRLIMRRAAKSSASVITISNYVKEKVIKRYGIDVRRVTTTYPAVDNEHGETTPYVPLKESRYLLYVGAAYPFKNLEHLIAGFKLLKPAHPGIKLVLVGKTDYFYKQLRAALSSNGEDIIFTGFVEEARLRWLYKNAEALVFPSLSEGFGLPGLEAMSHGTPVVASQASCLPEIYGEAAVYFDPLSPPDIAAKVRRVLNSSTERKNLVTLGFKQVKKYSWSKMASQTLAIYNKVHAKK